MHQETPPHKLLGELNSVEQKYAPKALFVRGDVSILNQGARVAIVGSRKASNEGLKRAAKLSKLLVDEGVVVVSGLAEGIDTISHVTAIEQNGRTIAVIGTPLNKAYPKRNERLQERIAQEHLLVSQFPEGYPTKPGCFPMRNRTMALLSDVTVIVEAGETSGSLSQGWEALRLGRGLYIAKSVVDDPMLKWPAEMLGHGASVLSDESIPELLSSLPNRLSLSSNEPIPF